ncbi:acetoacetate decarboxylase family protein [Burkholderia multivorans]|uniref:acetoacetate decarboxylase family protein n=1 Tax=Burkholderia multivorans TaxID=87883 RepID=UPI001C24635D|nr:acetoacetate decarboxylase family protein [Burkholderia multivorans]MBU9150393.1 acetoacetate decarboxylase family protein [Burkholderia multivorans]MBU9485088.1 acetoacetate decarboxylase family protein [Burkholderia multivorans]MBY4672094.1 acetoacetate decarboxylase family protein [Burkholderia multivorans]
MLYILVSGDMPVSIGREMWGEPKKTGFAQLYVDGHQMHGYGERDGVVSSKSTANLDRTLGPLRWKVSTLN